MARNRPEPIDPEFANLNLQQVLLEIDNYKVKLKDFKTKRNFVQQERELIANYYQISVEEQKNLEAQIEKESKIIEEMETNHKYEISAFSNKYQHLEFEHENFIEKTLVNDSSTAVDQEEAIRKKREEIFFNDKHELKNELKVDNEKNRNEIESEKENLKRAYDIVKKQLDDSLKQVKSNYEVKIKNLEADLELRLRIEIHELEERKNLHRACLVKSFDERMKNWKEESIQQIRENINLIKTNTENYDQLVEENLNLTKEEKSLDKEIAELSEKLAKSKENHSKIMNRLAKYYNQEINLKNMKSKIHSLKQKSREIEKKSNETFTKKESLGEEIEEIMNRYQSAVEKFKERAEYKNMLLDNHLKILNEKCDTKNTEIDELLNNVDRMASADDQGGFNRETVNNFLEDVRSVLITKSKIIKSLKYSISKATKAYNDTIRIYESKLIDFGIPPEELGYQLLESNTSKMPAGLVSA
mmetsp:Transcript_7011/g.7267  ORF Transcript_7011/g.7267 Transcript_7011/m.7267 type:complete len:473 (+) Transcript_7011:23-1441(+)